MTIKVLLFASYADAIGHPELSLELSAGARVSDALAAVRERVARVALPASPLMAVNAAYATLDHLLSEGDEVAIIPPVAGG